MDESSCHLILHGTERTILSSYKKLPSGSISALLSYLAAQPCFAAKLPKLRKEPEENLFITTLN